MRRIVPIALAGVVLGGVPLASPAGTSKPCTPRLLVLSAFPGEIDKLLTSATLSDTVVVEGRELFVGRLRGNAVVLALTGIGLVNAERTGRAALGHFRCGSRAGITGVVFSGVSGGRTYIGDVTVPSRWTGDDGRTWFSVDAKMLRKVREVKARATARLAQDAPLGDAACVGTDPGLVRAVHMPHRPEIIVGGDGKSADPFGGHAFLCIPGGGDVFGCRPCRAPLAAPDVEGFVSRVLPLVDPAFIRAFFSSPPPPTSAYTAEDEETAAVARVATRNRIPFIAFRALSDGLGDPLMLPGFPYQFFVYKQLAADNAATVALAFLEAWAAR